MLGSILRRPVHGSQAKANRKARRARRTLRFEGLEQRQMMAGGVTATLAASGVLNIIGTDQADAITVRQINNHLQIDGLSDSYAVSEVNRLVIDTRGGDDVVDLNSGVVAGQQPITIPATLIGGAGNDTLIGGSGPNTYVVGIREVDRLPKYKAGDTLAFDDPGKVMKSAVAPSGVIYTLQTDNCLYADGKASLGKTHDFAVAPDGSLYWLGLGGLLQRYTLGSGWRDVAYNTVKFAIAANGTCYSLGANDPLTINGRTYQNWLSINGQRAWAGYQDFALAPDSSLYLLGTPGVLERYNASSGWCDVAYNTVKFAIAANGTCYSLGANDPLTINGRTYQNWFSINGQRSWSGYQDFAMAADGSVYLLSTAATGGVLQKWTPSTSTWVDVAGSIVQLNVTPTGLTATLSGAGVLAVTGADQPDSITMRQINGRLQLDGLTDLSYAAAQVRQIVVDAHGGDDVVNLDSGSVAGQQPITVPAMIYGGSGNDTLIGGSGPNTYVVGIREADRPPNYKSGDTLVFDNPGMVLKSAVAPSGVIYTLQTDNCLYADGKASLGKTHDFAVAPDGSLYWLGLGGLLQRYTLGSGWRDVAYNTVKFAIAADGTCYSLSDINHTLYVNGQATWGYTQDFALAPDGILYWLATADRGRLLQKKAIGSSVWNDVAPNTSKFALAADGNCYSLSDSNHTLYVNGQATWGYTQDFALAPDGTLYWLATADRGRLLQKKAIGSSVWNDVAPNTSKFALAADGNCYSLSDSNHTLYVNGQAAWGYTQDFALATDGTLYWLGTADRGRWLQSKAPGPSVWQYVAPNTVKFAIAADGTCYSLSDSNQTLYVNGGKGGSWGYTQDFALGPDGTLYCLGTSGILQSQSPGQSGWTDMAGGVHALIALRADGSIVTLDKSGDIALRGAGGIRQVVGRVSRAQVGGRNVVQLDAEPAKFASIFDVPITPVCSPVTGVCLDPRDPMRKASEVTWEIAKAGATLFSIANGVGGAYALYTRAGLLAAIADYATGELRDQILEDIIAPQKTDTSSNDLNNRLNGFVILDFSDGGLAVTGSVGIGNSGSGQPSVTLTFTDQSGYGIGVYGNQNGGGTEIPIPF